MGKILKGKKKYLLSLVLSLLLVLNVNITTYRVFALENNNTNIRQVFVSDEIIVKFKPLVTTNDLSTFYSNYGLSTKRNISLTNNTKLMKIESNDRVEDVLKKLNNNKFVEWAQPNYYYYPSSTPTDTYWDLQWGHHNTGQTIYGISGTNDIDIDALEAWSNHTITSSTVVAVIDTGTDINHPDLADNIWINTAEKNGTLGVDDDNNGYVDDIYGWDFYHNDNTVFDSETGDGHGTHVSGIIAGVSNNIGIKGTSSNTKIMPLKFIEQGGTTADAIDAIDYASLMGADVINASWGGPSDITDIALNDAILNSGTVFVAAAGNEGIDNDSNSISPASLSASNIISVAAVNNKGELASFSNYGATSVDVGAPGVDIVSTYPNNQYVYMSGTSMAAPFVSGIAADAIGKDPTLSTTQVIDLIKNSGVVFQSLSGKTSTGKMVNLNNTLNNTLPPKGTIAYPKDGDTVSGTTEVAGWFLDGNGVQKIEVLIDGVVVGTANYGNQRLDVSAAFPEYNNDYSGYNYTLDTTTLDNGNHTITIRETSTLGIKTTLTNKTINVSN